MSVTPIFVFSLPRSGSTLFQRLLVNHPQISSTSEPWILLPLLYSRSHTGVLAEYTHYNCATAIQDLITQLPNKEDDYYTAIRSFSNTIYNKLSQNGEKYFLDKTPRYHLIAKEIVDVYPKAKFIFLIREPVQIIASVINTYGNGRLNKLYSHRIDLLKGYENLAQAYLKVKEQSILIHYDSLVRNPQIEFDKAWKYLGIEAHGLHDVSDSHLKGNLGDPTMGEKYKNISDKSIESWKVSINNSLRKQFILRTIMKIDNASLNFLGMSKVDIIDNLKNHKVNVDRFILIDAFDIVANWIRLYLKPQIFFSRQIFSWSNGFHLR